MREERRLSRALNKEVLEKSTVEEDAEFDEKARKEYADFISVRDASDQRRATRFIEKATDNYARIDVHENGADRHPVQQPIGLIVPSKKDSGRDLRVRIRELKKHHLPQESKALEKIERKKDVQKRKDNKALKRKQALAKKVEVPASPSPKPLLQQTFSNLVFRTKPSGI